MDTENPGGSQYYELVHVILDFHLSGRFAGAVDIDGMNSVGFGVRRFLGAIADIVRRYVNQGHVVLPAGGGKI